jgi:hypothetical protein
VQGEGRPGSAAEPTCIVYSVHGRSCRQQHRRRRGVRSQVQRRRPRRILDVQLRLRCTATVSA